MENYSTEAEVYLEGGNRINVDIPGVTNANQILEEMGQPGTLVFRTEDGTEVINGNHVVNAQAYNTRNELTNAVEYGVQLTLNADQDATITATETLNGFEQVGAWMDENSYLFLAYNMGGRVIPAGKQPILNIGDAEITDIRLSDRDGHNIMATPAEEVVTGIGVLKADVTSKKQGTYDMMGRRVTGTKHLQPGIYIVNGKKVVVK